MKQRRSSNPSHNGRSSKQAGAGSSAGAGTSTSKGNCGNRNWDEAQERFLAALVEQPGEGSWDEKALAFNARFAGQVKAQLPVD